MSASFALVRFNKTGNIYYGCYEGTSDMMRPHLCTPEECYNANIDCYCAISHCRELSKYKPWKLPENASDIDDIEIYTDYGGGFYWNGTGNESIKMIKDGLEPFGECYKDMKNGAPEWVKEFLKHQDG